jgi:hypothetical protein
MEGTVRYQEGRCHEQGWFHDRRSSHSRAFGWRLVTVLLAAVALAVPARADAPPLNVPVTPAGGSLSFLDPTLAVDPTNHSHLAIASYEYSQGRQCSLALSSDAGRTWSNKVVVGDGGQVPLTSEQVKCYSPKIAYGPSGTLYFVYQAARPRPMPRQVLITTSHDGGATFGPPVLLGDMTDRIVYQQVAVAVDQGSARVYAAWADVTDPNNARVLVASSSDQGRTFSAPVQPNLPNPQVSEGPDEPSLVVEPDHTVHVGWRVFLAGPPNSVLKYVATSKDQGRTFGPPGVVLRDLDPGCAGGTSECRRPVEYAADNVSAELARGISPGRLFAVGWGPEGGTATNNRRLVFASSHDGGASWSASKIVGIPAGHQSDDQARPSIAVTPSGRIEIVYQNLPTSEGGVQNIFEIHSDDNGSTFSAPRLLNSAPSDIRIGPASFSTFNGGNTASFGAHPTVAASESAVFTAWTDSRRGTLDTGKQDIFFAALPTPPSFSRFSISPQAFAVTFSGHRHGVHRGTTIRFTLSESASVRFGFTRRVAGRVVGTRCVAVTRANRQRRRCVRFVGVGSFTRPARLGDNQPFFLGRLGGRALSPGWYLLTLNATDAAGYHSSPRSRSFRIVLG